MTSSRSLQAQHLTHAVADLVLVLGASLSPHLGRLDVGRTLVVGLGQHAHDGDEDLLDRLDRGPALGCVLVVVGVVARSVEDRDADKAAGVDYIMLELAVDMVFRGEADEPLGCHTSARNFMDGGARG
jgi:hypothetical protein